MLSIVIAAAAAASAAAAPSLPAAYEGRLVRVEVGATVCNAFAYGAVGDGRADDTAALQRALTACANGGTAFLPANGTFLSFGISASSASNFALRIDGRECRPGGLIKKCLKAKPQDLRRKRLVSQ